MTFGAEIWGPPLIAAGASYLSGQGNAAKETKMDKTKRKLVDQLLASLTGEGPYSDLYNKDENAFQKSFVEPAQSMFRNQIAPQIQQQFIASGQHRGTGLDDQLLRAGVDLDSMLNQQFYQFGQDSLNRKQNTINSILNGGSGAANETSAGQDIMSGLGGYLQSPGFADSTANLFKSTPQPAAAAPQAPPRRGFAPDWSDYSLGDQRWGTR